MEKILTEDNIENTVKEILMEVNRKSLKHATIAAFYGDLGVGKTTITKEIARQLGVKESVISPTFVIMKIYKTKDSKFKKLIHIDAYRLNGSKELFQLGWEEIIQDKENFIIIEWPNRVPECLDEDVFNVEIEHKDEKTRKIKWEYNIKYGEKYK
jgi:tRNA threonylcarbamoyladenosine biosynthesis protein TsaE